MSLSSRTRREKGKRRNGRLIAALCLFDVLLGLSTSGYAHAARQEQPREALGSMSSVGEVIVNDSPAPVESTIFSGDRVRTGENGTATFTVSGKGTLKIFPRSELVFPGTYQFTAELKTGSVVLSSISGPGRIILRAGNYVLLSSFRQQSATTKVEGTANGSFLISCLDGSVGILTIDAKSGQFLQAGQSLTISGGAVLSSASGAPNSPSATGHNFHSSWLYLGLGGGAAAAVAAGLARGGGKQSVSPSAP